MTSWRGLAAAVWLVALAVPGAGHAQSLWRDGAPGAALFTDHRARGVDDIVTIVISEQATSSRSANTTTSKDTSRQAAVTEFPTMFDPLARTIVKPITKPWLGFKTPSQVAEDDLRLNMQSKAEHTGKGSIDRSDRLTGQIPARIVKVLDNGNLLIEGRRAMIVNDESQVLTISGVIRPDDLTSTNTVLSSQIADAEIQMVGRGVLAEAQRPGIIYRLLDWLNLF